MRPPLLHVSCSDLHPGCGRQLWGRGAEDLVLAYVMHHQDEHVVAQVDLEHLLSSVTVWAPGLQSGAAGSVSRALSVAG